MDINQEITECIDVLYGQIKSEYDIWVIKSKSKTQKLLSLWVTGLQVLKQQALNDTFNGQDAMHTFKLYGMSRKTLPGCFRGKTKTQKELVNVLYGNLISKILILCRKKNK